MFTQRHYEWLARFLAEDPLPERTRTRLAFRLADRLALDNPAFKPRQFYAAAGIRYDDKGQPTT